MADLFPKAEAEPQKPVSDKDMLDWLDKQSGTYTGKVIWRQSAQGRGWRLHETERINSFDTVREAIAAAMLAAKENPTSSCKVCRLAQSGSHKTCARCGASRG